MSQAINKVDFSPQQHFQFGVSCPTNLIALRLNTADLAEASRYIAPGPHKGSLC